MQMGRSGELSLASVCHRPVIVVGSSICVFHRGNHGEALKKKKEMGLGFYFVKFDSFRIEGERE